MRKLPVKIAPLPEQQRIVAKIEELFSDLDASVAALIQTQAQLRIYRQAVLKYAFEGRLTAAWREQHNPPPAADLLAQIKTERAARYRQQLADWQAEMKAWEAAGKAGRKPSKPRPVTELPPLSEAELAELPALPEGWVWAKLANAVEDMRLGKMLDKNKNRGVYQPYLRNINVRWGSFDLSSLAEMRFESYEDEIFGIRQGDLIVCEGGEPGRAAIWKDQVPGMKIQKALHRVKLFERSLVNSYLLHYLLYSSQTGHLEKFITGTTIKHLTGEGLRNLTTPLCSYEEQQAIVDEIDSRLSVVDKLEETIAAALQQAEALRQSILKRAFAGKLVPQDANDEPASVLLERIRKARED